MEPPAEKFAILRVEVYPLYPQKIARLKALGVPDDDIVEVYSRRRAERKVAYLNRLSDKCG